MTEFTSQHSCFTLYHCFGTARYETSCNHSSGALQRAFEEFAELCAALLLFSAHITASCIVHATAAAVSSARSHHIQAAAPCCKLLLVAQPLQQLRSNCFSSSNASACALPYVTLQQYCCAVNSLSAAIYKHHLHCKQLHTLLLC
jgi:hypothetical protein